MKTASQDTIYALASGQVPAGIAIVRISGPNCRFITETMCGGWVDGRRASLRMIKTSDGVELDRALVLCFAGPDSFTGEDSLELHLHGSRAVVASVYRALAGISDTRPAEAGEFTMRAFLNGRIDLTGAEALADLVEAETEEQRRFALANTGRAHGDLYREWRARIVNALAELTAAIDFGDEADVAETLNLNRLRDLQALTEEIDSHLKQFRASEIIREGFRVAIIGPPNAGKSSLLNALAKRDVAIVTDVPGTTRDVLEVPLDLGGRKVVVSDTAGIREEAELVERIGIERALAAARSSDLVLVISDCGSNDCGAIEISSDAPILRIGNKIDLGNGGDSSQYDLVISARTGEGLDTLLGKLSSVAADAAGHPSIIPFRQRHAVLLGEARDALLDTTLEPGAEVEIVAENLRRAADRLGRIAGSVDVEDLLDAIFSRFCVGK